MSAPVPTRLSPRVDDRQSAIDEIFTSEVTYLRGIKFFGKAYMHSHQFHEHVPLTVQQKMQVKIRTITAVSTSLLHELAKAVGVDPFDAVRSTEEYSGEPGICIPAHETAHTDPGLSMAEAFLKLEPQFALYFDYTRYFNSFLQAVNEAAGREEGFSTFLKEVSDRDGALTFMAYLIMPIQRVPRYGILMKAVLKQTPQDHPSHETIAKAYRSMSAVGDKLDKSQKQQERLDQLVELSKRFEGLDIPLVQPHRRFYFEATVEVWTDEVASAAYGCGVDGGSGGGGGVLDLSDSDGGDSRGRSSLSAASPRARSKSKTRTRSASKSKSPRGRRLTREFGSFVSGGEWGPDEEDLISTGEGELGTSLGAFAAWRKKRCFLFSDMIVIAKNSKKGGSTLRKNTSGTGGDVSDPENASVSVQMCQFLRYVMLGDYSHVSTRLPGRQDALVVERGSQAPILIAFSSRDELKSWKDIMRSCILHQHSTFDKRASPSLLPSHSPRVDGTTSPRPRSASHSSFIEPLSDSDLTSIFENATATTYARDDVIIKMGQEQHDLFRVISGSIRVEVPAASKDGENNLAHVITYGHTGSVFGEIGYLDVCGTAACSIVCDSETAVVERLRSSWLALLLRVEPRLNNVFHRYLATKLATHLIDVPSGIANRKPPVTPEQRRQSSDQRQAKQHEESDRNRDAMGGGSGDDAALREDKGTSKGSKKSSKDKKEKKKKSVGKERSRDGERLVCQWDKQSGSVVLGKSGMTFSAKRFGRKIERHVSYVAMCDQPSLNGDESVVVKFIDSKQVKRKIDIVLPNSSEYATFCQRVFELKQSTPRQGGETAPPLSSSDRVPSISILFASLRVELPPPLPSPSPSLAQPEQQNEHDERKVTLHEQQADLFAATLQKAENMPTDEDWNIIWDNSSEMVFERNEFLLTEGKSSRRWFQIMSGEVQIQRSTKTRKTLEDCPIAKVARDSSNFESGGKLELPSDLKEREQELSDDDVVVLNQLGADDVVGEISFLLDTPASASVVASSEKVVARVIDCSLLNRICEFKTGLASRLYRYLAVVSAQRLVDMQDTLYNVQRDASGAIVRPEAKATVSRSPNRSPTVTRRVPMSQRDPYLHMIPQNPPPPPPVIV